MYDKIYETEEDAVAVALQTKSQLDRTWAVLSFKELDIDNGRIDYTIRTNYSVVPSTRYLSSRFLNGVNRRYQGYFLSGFLTLQSTIETYVLEKSNYTVTTGPQLDLNAELVSNLVANLTLQLNSTTNGTFSNITSNNVVSMLQQVTFNTSALNYLTVNTSQFIALVEEAARLSQNGTAALRDAAASIPAGTSALLPSELNPALLARLIPPNFDLSLVNTSSLPANATLREAAESIGLDIDNLPAQASMGDILGLFNMSLSDVVEEVAKELEQTPLADFGSNQTIESLMQDLQDSLTPNDAGFTGIPFPVPAYEQNPFYSSVGPLVGMIFCMSMIYPTSKLIKSIVEEKETRMKETMKIMGLKDWVFAASWFMTYAVMFSLIAFLQALVLKTTVLRLTDLSLSFAFFFLFNMTNITFSFLVSVFFSRAKLAAIVGPIAMFVTVLPRYAFFTAENQDNIFGKSCASLLAASGFAFGGDLLMEYEDANMGLQWTDLYKDDFSFGGILTIMLFDFFLYGLLAWYFEHVLPNQYGTRKPFYFCCTRRYWCGYRPSWSGSSIEESLLESDSLQGPGNPDVEDIPKSMVKDVSVRTRNLRKTFKMSRKPGRAGAEFVAVKSLNLAIMKNEITSLLGHNGAGKTTTISMLTGLIPSTSGTCYINGMDINHDMTEIRKSLGICPQHNVLFDQLSCEEHLTLFATLKGVDPAALKREVERTLNEVGLGHKKDAFSHTLSGGMKRKLSVAMALIGGSKVVFLDEPTSGMDPYSRRATWSLIKKYKKNRAIVLTTHFMDEADLLGDRIAIMSHGELKCYGSSLFLKSRFGVGYNLTMVKATSDFDEEAVNGLVSKHIPETKILSSAAGELALQLPFTRVSTFPALFEEVEERRIAMGIGGYGISMTTLEDVFLKITHLQVENSKSKPDHGDGISLLRSSSKVWPSNPVEIESSISRQVTISGAVELQTMGAQGANEQEPSVTVGGIEMSVNKSISRFSRPQSPLTQQHQNTSENASDEAQNSGEKRAQSTRWVQFSELVQKRFIVARRDLKGRFFEILLPVGIVALVLLVLTNNWTPNGPSILLNYELYNTQSKHIPRGTKSSIFSQSDSSMLRWNEMSSMNDRGAVVYPMQCNTSKTCSNFLLDTFDKDYGVLRIGAYVSNDTITSSYKIPVIPLNLTPGVSRRITYNNFDLNTPSSYTIFHNSSHYHALPILGAELTASRLSSVWGNKGNTTYYRLRNHPLPLTEEGRVLMQTFLTIFAALFVLIPFCYLPAQFCTFVVKERTIKAKHLQLVSGVHPVIYWISNFVWDMINYLIVISCCMIVFFLYESPQFSGTAAQAWGTFYLLFLYGLAVIPMSYCYSFLFTNHSSAQVGVTVLHFVAGFILIITSFVLDADSTTSGTNAKLKPFYRMLPPFNLGEGLINLSTFDYYMLVGGEKDRSPWEWEFLGRSMVCLSCEFVGFMLITLLIEYSYVRKALSYCSDKLTKHIIDRIRRKPKLEKISTIEMNQPVAQQGETDGRRSSIASLHEDEVDGDVQAEVERLSTGRANHELLCIKGLTKIYPPRGNNVKHVRAVNNLHLAVPHGQCFGFLGINGAGKTTTMLMLTGDVEPTEGDATIRGHSINTEMAQVRQEIGYCPQFDPLLDLMTAREHLRMYAKIRGITGEKKIEETVTQLLEKLSLSPYADKPSGGYSGGNKRKLSLGLALIGDPSVVFLDEPSTGMDPVSRRFMWNVISKISKERSVILTTHSMEECEALCGRIGIMVNGRMRCIGSIQHLKSKFGGGYHMEISSDEKCIEGVIEFVEQTFPGSSLAENHGTRLKYVLPNDMTMNLSTIFGTLESSKARLGIKDYSISQVRHSNNCKSDTITISA